MKLDNAVVLITGSSRGIGRAVALEMARKGAKVGINYVTSDEEAQDVKTKIEKLGSEALLVKGDVADIGESQQVMNRVMEVFGRIDVLVNNAGIILWTPLDETRLRKLHRVLDVNVKGMVNMSYAAVPLMKEQGSGVILNIASGAGKTGYANLTVYSASKFAVLGFTEALAKELEADGIRVYAVSPGTTATDMTGGEGMPPRKVAERIAAAAEESLGLLPGEDTEIYS